MVVHIYVRANLDIWYLFTESLAPCTIAGGRIQFMTRLYGTSLHRALFVIINVNLYQSPDQVI